MTRTVLRSLGALLMASAVVASARDAQGQTSSNALAANKGLHGERGYFSPESFEHFDTMSGNLVLSFADLVLPGNAGRALRFQRNYNNQRQTTGLPAGSVWPNTRWQFGFPGMVMRVVEKEIPPGTVFNNLTAQNGGIHTTPVFVMDDGSFRLTIYVLDPRAAGADPATMEVISSEYYKYDRGAHTLRMPDGTVCHYDPETGRLTSFEDQFNNLVELAWSETALVVTQHVGSNVRVITLSLDPEGRVTRMEYAGREWIYDYANGDGDITHVQLPEGLTWDFAYDNVVPPPQAAFDGYEAKGLVSITTPNKGIITYSYVEATAFDPVQQFTEERRYLSARHSEGPRGTAAGTWQITLFANGLVFGQYASIQTRILTPSQVQVSFWHSSTTTYPYLLERAYGLTQQTVGQSQDETVAYRELRLASWTSVKVPETSVRRIFRHGRTFTTRYTYVENENFGDYHHPRTITESGHLSRTTTFAYTHLMNPWILGMPVSETVQTTNADVFRRTWTQDQRGFRTSEMSWFRPAANAGILTQYTPDAFGNIASKTVSGRPATTFSYEGGSLKDTTTPLYTVSREINPDGTLASETIAGRTTSFQYDLLMRQKRVTPPGGVNPTLTEYDNLNGAFTVMSTGLSSVTTTLDGFGRPVATVDSRGLQTRTEYDAEARVRFQSGPFDATHPEARVETRYDELDRVTEAVNADGSSRRQAYADGLTTVTDEEGHSTELRLRAFGHPDDTRLASVKDAAAIAWTYTYNALGAITRVAAPNNIQRLWTYDDFNRLIQQVQPESGTTQFTYDAAAPHLLASRTDANGNTFAHTYDANDRLTRMATGVRFTQTDYVNGSDAIERTTTESVTTTFAYDSAGRVRSREDTISAGTFASAYQYNSSGNVTEVLYPSGRAVSYDYNSEQLVTRVFEAATNRDYATNFTYHPNGDIEGYTAGNQTTTSIQRDPVRSWVTSVTSGPLSLAYTTYDRVGNVQALNDARPGNNQSFGYDALDRLTSAAGPYGSLVYRYNAHGNRLNANGSTYAYEAGTLRLSSQNGVAFTYDNNGNTRTAGGATYTYTPANMLETAQVGATTASYLYDGQGQRIRASVGPATTLFLRGPAGELLSEIQDPESAPAWRDYVYAGGHLVAAVARDGAGGGGGILYDFETGESLAALGFTDIIDVSTQSGGGFGEPTWGVRGDESASASEKYYGEASVPVTATGREFQFEADFGHDDSAYSRFGYSAFEMRYRATGSSFAAWFLSLYHGVGDTATARDRLQLYLGNGQEWTSGPGVIVPGTRQTLTVQGTLSTVTDFEVNPDGAVKVLVNGVVVFDVTGVSLGLDWIENGVAPWNVLMFNPMGRFDNLRIGAAAPDPALFYHSDALGSVRAITDDIGQVVDRLDYLPFGERFNPGTTNERLEFAGKELDQQTGLSYFGARYFSSQTGRFTSADPFLDVSTALADPQQWNRYAYVRNNPLAFIDPTGLDCVYTLSDVGTIEQGGSADECGRKGGTWVPGTIAKGDALYNSVTGLFQVASSDGNNVYYATFGTGAQTNASGKCIATCKGAEIQHADAAWLRSMAEGQGGSLEDMVSFMVNRTEKLKGGLLNRIASGPLAFWNNNWAGPGGMGPPQGRGDWTAMAHDYVFKIHEITIGTYFDPSIPQARSEALIRANHMLMRNAGGMQAMKMGAVFGVVNAFQWFNTW